VSSLERTVLINFLAQPEPRYGIKGRGIVSSRERTVLIHFLAQPEPRYGFTGRGIVAPAVRQFRRAERIERP
jgi:hypothetical protein